MPGRAPDNRIVWGRGMHMIDMETWSRRYHNEFLKRFDRPHFNMCANLDIKAFYTAIPWVSFTSFAHPMNLQPADSIPRFAWGK
jgi:chloramphenicol O-acetyltransferase